MGQHEEGMAGNVTSPNAGWLSVLFSDNGSPEDIEDSQSCGQLFWATSAPSAEQAECSAEGDNHKGEVADANKKESTVNGRKRDRDESHSTASCKASREKMRRDRLNERFTELSALLEPGRQPKTDKATILVDAIRIVTQLRNETAQLKETNRQLSESIKELKSEKNELRDEKARLKMEKDRLEMHMKSMVPASYLTHPAAAALATSHGPKVGSTGAPPFTPGFMWQWIPPSALDTSHDGLLRPPVA
ncbi:bHLH transcription factor [Chara braunii]|uniref:BHLH transcription factor n=1 Tax=Chara braunii TaxID=69332 RepID=A0A388K8H8_CHABU|nr:bHLH transcription factor [Chara braunii]|eukprot:GBG66316.1 bHLH transcription factor [Chara braunii]